MNVSTRLLAAACLTLAAHVAGAQTPTWFVPASSTRAVLLEWSRSVGYGVVWSDGIPDFPTHERNIEAPFYVAIRELVSGYGTGSLNLYCPPSTHFPATAYGVDARIDDAARLIFVFGVPSDQECRPL